MLKNKAEKYFKYLMIEPTNVCNLQCPICPSGNSFLKNNPKVEQGFMNFQHFKKIIRPVRDWVKGVNLWGFGEPFLAPDIVKMINYLGKHKIVVTVHTNGTLLNKKIANQLRDNYRRLISFSIDGLTQKTYAYYRRGGNLKKVLDNLSYLIRIKKKYNLYKTEIIWQFLINSGNEHEVPYVEEVAKKIGVDRLRLKTIGASKKNEEFIPQNKRYQRKKDNKIERKECEFINPGMPTILWNGDVVVCCQDYFKDYVMGNAIKENLLDIWDGYKYRKFRESYFKRKNEICNKQCKINSSLIFLKEIYFNRTN